MRRVLRENATCALLAIAGCFTTAWLSLYGPGWNDYEVEARPAFEALVHGHVGEFLRLAPVYGGSLVERAPFALLPGIWSGGSLAVYRSVAVPCLLAAALLAVWLVARMRAAGRPRLDRALVLILCVANPVTLTALELGHPEELLGGCMCVLALLLAAAPSVSIRRALAVGLLLGLAIANKEWALLALGPVLMALPPGRRAICLAAAGAAAAAVLAPLLLGSGGSFSTSTNAVASAGSAIFQPWQVFWFFGHHGALVHGALGNAKPGYRIGPSWAGTVSHPLIVLAGGALAMVLWTSTRGGRMTTQRALLALTLILLARCLLDTWDALYYPLPFLIAMLAWESGNPSKRPPLMTLMASALMWSSFHWLPEHVSPDLQSLIFLAWTLPLEAWLAVKLFAGPSPELGLRAQSRIRPAAQPITVNALDRRVSASAPPARTTTRSSIRTPSIPGR
jgi:hypothetical protein